MTSGTITREQFEVRQIKDKRALSAQKKQVLICAGTGCIAGGSLDIYDYLKEACAKRGIQVQVGLLHEDGEVEAPAKGRELHLKKSGCHGFCEMGPLLQIEPDGILYTHVQVSDCDEIIDKTLLKGELVERLLYQLDGVTYAKHDEIPFYKKQHRVVLENCGSTDAEDIDEYIARDGYSAFEKALFEMTDEEICKEISDSGLRGRGGGGFPAGRKWDSVRKQPPGKKYVVCNGDEGDPGAFMDRSIMEGNPHSIIEGMLIAGVAAGSDEGYIYVRAEYPLAVSRLKTAIAKAEEMGFLGDHIMGTDFSFHLHVNRGAGAFVCGEGSALTASIEGNRGMPRVKPPRTVEKGLWARPTVLNNVETYANIPQIILKGADWFRSIGTEKSPGTKVFALGGKITNTGLVEVPMGTTLREVVEEIGGGVPGGHTFKAAQTGGPSGGCIPAKLIDTPIDYDNLLAIGSMMGSGGLIVMDETTCMVDIAKFFLEFTVDESCGKCTPCRVGTKRLLEILNKITSGNGTLEDITTIEELCEHIKSSALCGLGQTAPNPVLSTLHHFRDEYIAHVVEKRCPAGVCKNLLHFVIDPGKCKGCTLCAKNCPADAIMGAVKAPHVIDPNKCIKCGACMDNCRFGAISKH